MNFTDLGINELIMRSLENLGFQEPTPIQIKSIPALLTSKIDYVGLAQTGTGKTAAFGIPLISKIDTNKRSVQAIVLCPTRELCLQITKELKNYAAFIPKLQIVAIYGGASINEQANSLRRGAQLIVGTPGRVIDLINRNVLHLDSIATMVLDEADEMLNMGFQEDINTILENTPSDKNIWLFSATMPEQVEKIANNYMTNPLRVTVGSRNSSARNITHYYATVRRDHVYTAIRRIIEYSTDIFGIIFCRTKRDAKELADRLVNDKHRAEALHGDLSQSQRDAIMAKFRNRQIDILVATDVAARGIDVNDVTHVIHHNLPEDVEVYTHRSGRTARAGKSGVSLSIITGQRELRKIRYIERHIGQSITQFTIPSGQDVLQAQLNHLAQTITNTQPTEDVRQTVTNLQTQLSNLSAEELFIRLFALNYATKISAKASLNDLNASLSSPKFDHDSNQEHSTSKRSRERGHGTTMFLQMNLGQQEGFDKGRLINFICTKADISGRLIGKIEIQKNNSFFSVDDEETAERIMQKTNGHMLDGKKLSVTKASGKFDSFTPRRFNNRSSERRHSYRR